ncbi:MULTISPECIES: hypothetical protein [unclassified Bradyrhizobium]|uniref:hypothetical protein n=1 Tax=unclassified Bradyrhizobium TaxID=2631580 RepID=UPI002916A9B2|nr:MULTISPECIES: hypothetical protein [unclassified Bradyrhizobium]
MSHRTRLITGAATAINRPRPGLKGREAIEQMADDMRVIVTRTGGVTAEDLTLIGWKRDQVETLNGRARDLAIQLSTVAA